MLLSFDIVALKLKSLTIYVRFEVCSEVEKLDVLCMTWKTDHVVRPRKQIVS